MDQLALFPADAVVGTGQLCPWPTAEADTAADVTGIDPDQLTFDEAGTEGAA